MVKRAAKFLAIYVAVALICSIRVPVVVSGVASDSWGPRAYTNLTSDYAYVLIRNWVRSEAANRASSNASYWSSTPPAKDQSTTGATGGRDIFDQVVSESAEAGPLLDSSRYAIRLVILFVVVGVVWFGVMPYYPELKPYAWLLPLFIYATAARLSP